MTLIIAILIIVAIPFALLIALAFLPTRSLEKLETKFVRKNGSAGKVVEGSGVEEGE